LGGLRDARAQKNTPSAPQKRHGSQYRQVMSLVTSPAVQLVLPDEPLPITRQCEKAVHAITSANDDKQTNEMPSRRCAVMLINAMPSNVQSSGTAAERDVEMKICRTIS